MAPENSTRHGPPLRVLFVCVGNSCRSQLAEALARERAQDVIAASSAGISPLGHIAETTRRILLENGVRSDGQYSKGLAQVSLLEAELIVNMSGIPGGALFPGRKVVDWDIEDPYGEDLAVYRRVFEDIEQRLAELTAELRTQRDAGDSQSREAAASSAAGVAAKAQASTKGNAGVPLGKHERP